MYVNSQKNGQKKFIQILSFGYDEKNTMRTIHIIRHTEIQYFNPPILLTHHTSTYLFKPNHLIMIHFVSEYHNI